MATAPAQDAVIDRTLILDPTSLWTDPLDCPDWPIVDPLSMQHMTLVTGKAAAEARLTEIALRMNNGSRNLRRPTADECHAEFDRVFDPGKSPMPRWHALGLSFGPRKLLTENEAELIVEAAHLRGYLRKLDAKAKSDAVAKAQAAIERDQRKLSGYVQHLEDSAGELARLHEGAARHRQRIEDERAFRRLNDLQAGLRGAFREACSAAQRLEVDMPAAPVFPGE